MEERIFFNTRQAALFLDVSPNTLKSWRAKKKYNLCYRRIGGKIRYHIDDLKNFLDSQIINSMDTDF